MSQPAIKDNGLSYVGDEGVMSVYVLQVEGVPALHVLVDNLNEATEEGVQAPEGSTLHRIYLATTDRKVTLETKGVAAKVAHIDGDGVSAPHIDGITVAHYLLPRFAYWMTRLIQARQEV